MRKENKLENIEHDGVVPVKVFYFKEEEQSLAKIVMPHWHRDIELDYLVRGNSVMIIRGASREMKTGEIVLVNSEHIHSSVRSRRGSEEESIALLIDYDYMKKYYGELDYCCFCETFTSEQQEFLGKKMSEVAEIYLSSQPFKEMKITKNMFDIMIYLLENCVDKMVYCETLESRKMRNISRAIEYIDQNYWQSITLKTMGEYLGLDEAYFSRSFRAMTGECFKDYLQQKRLSMSIKDLVDSGKTVTDIAYKNGFPNLKSYITTFKKYYSVTPKQYIRKQKKKMAEQSTKKDHI